MSTLEQRIRLEVARVITNSSNFPEPMRVHMWGRDLSEPIDMIAAALAPVIREAQADLVDALADELGSIQHGAEIAEVAAHVPGEVGRQACIDAWESILDEPDEWLREKAREHLGNERDHLQELLAGAWLDGTEAAFTVGCQDPDHNCEHCGDPDSLTNPYWSNDE